MYRRSCALALFGMAWRRPHTSLVFDPSHQGRPLSPPTKCGGIASVAMQGFCAACTGWQIPISQRGMAVGAVILPAWLVALPAVCRFAFLSLVQALVSLAV